MPLKLAGVEVPDNLRVLFDAMISQTVHGGEWLLRDFIEWALRQGHDLLDVKMALADAMLGDALYVEIRRTGSETWGHSVGTGVERLYIAMKAPKGHTGKWTLRVNADSLREGLNLLKEQGVLTEDMLIARAGYFRGKAHLVCEILACAGFADVRTVFPEVRAYHIIHGVEVPPPIRSI